MGKNDTPRVPVETPMYESDERGGQKLTRPWIIFFERLGNHSVRSGAAAEKKATFGLLKDLTVSIDLTNHFISRSSGAFVDVAVNAKDPPTGSKARLQIQKSVDFGASWRNIFKAPGYIELAIGNSGLQLWTRDDQDIFAAADDGKIAIANFLRVNCTQKGSTNAGKNIEIVLRWG